MTVGTQPVSTVSSLCDRRPPNSRSSSIARKRRSPATKTIVSPARLTTMGCINPSFSIFSLSSTSFSGSNSAALPVLGDLD